MECAGRAKRRRRFMSDKLQFVAPLSPLRCIDKLKFVGQSKAESPDASGLPPRSNYFSAFVGRGPRPNSSGFGSVEVVSYFRSASSMARLLANQSEII